jgi:hypothetical protein
MKNKKILKQFIIFLKRNKAYNDYLINLKNDTFYRRENALIQEENDVIWLVNTIKRCPSRLIVDAFHWHDKVNGIEWDRLSSKWSNKVKKINHEIY